MSYVVPLPLFLPRKIFGRSRHLGVSFFVWTVAWDRILRGDNLRSRGFDFVN